MDCLVDAVGGVDVDDADGFGLALAVQPGVGLFVEFQAPGGGVPDHDVAACLEVESVAG